LKLECDELLSSFGFEFNLRRYNEVLVDRGPSPFLSKIEAYDRGQLITTIQVGRCRLTPSNPS